jgi:hypothetical protein
MFHEYRCRYSRNDAPHARVKTCQRTPVGESLNASSATGENAYGSPGFFIEVIP